MPSAMAVETAVVVLPSRARRQAAKLSGKAQSRPMTNNPTTKSEAPNASPNRRAATTLASAPKAMAGTPRSARVIGALLAGWGCAGALRRRRNDLEGDLRHAH